MRFSFSIDSGSDGSEEPRGPVTVGWLLKDPRAGVVFEPPARCRSPESTSDNAKSASRCPAILNLESRFYEVKCPFDLHLQLSRDQSGQLALNNMLGEKSSIRNSILKQILKIAPVDEWRYGDKPTLQLQLPYIFIADEPVFLSQLAPFLAYNPKPWPGVPFAGRFPIHVWPRPLVWAFEWHDTSKPLLLNRGDPLFYLQFETTPQDRPTRLIKAARTPELESYLEHIGGAVNFVSQTFSLFESAARERPRRLLEPDDVKD